MCLTHTTCNQDSDGSYLEGLSVNPRPPGDAPQEVRILLTSLMLTTFLKYRDDVEQDLGNFF